MVDEKAPRTQLDAPIDIKCKSPQTRVVLPMCVCVCVLAFKPTPRGYPYSSFVVQLGAGGHEIWDSRYIEFSGYSRFHVRKRLFGSGKMSSLVIERRLSKGGFGVVV